MSKDWIKQPRGSQIKLIIGFFDDILMYSSMAHAMSNQTQGGNVEKKNPAHEDRVC